MNVFAKRVEPDHLDLDGLANLQRFRRAADTLPRTVAPMPQAIQDELPAEAAAASSHEQQEDAAVAINKFEINLRLDSDTTFPCM